MAEEDKVDKASQGESGKGSGSERPSDAGARKPDTSPPASGRRQGSTSAVFNTDEDADTSTSSGSKPGDPPKPQGKDSSVASTERAPDKPSSATSAETAKPNEGLAAQKKDSSSTSSDTAPAAKNEPKTPTESTPPKADASKDTKASKPGDATVKSAGAEANPGDALASKDKKATPVDEKKSVTLGAKPKVGESASPKKKAFGEVTQKSIAPTNEKTRRQSSPPKAEDTGRLQTIQPPAGSAAAAASKVPPPPGVAARTVPPPERHVPTAAPPGIGRMEEKLNSLSLTLRNYIVGSVALLVAFAIALVYEARTGWLHFSATGPTYGKIYVDRPEIVSRERLVHDQAVQDEWLRALLGTPPKPPGSTPEPRPATLSAAQAEAGKVKPAPPGSAAASAPPVQPPSVEAAEEAGAVAGFHDQLAFRNEVRAELIDNLLDDGQGPAGNTLYLLKFDSTLVPEEHTTAFGVVRVDVASSYEKAVDRGAGQDLTSEAGFDAFAKKVLEWPAPDLERLSDLYALFGKSLESVAARIDGEQARGRRRIQDALRSNMGADDNAPWLGDLKPDSSPAEQWSDAAIEQLDLDDLYAFTTYLGEASTARNAAGACPEGRDVQVALERIDCVLGKLTSGKGRGKRAAREAKLAELYAAYYVDGPGARLSASLTPFATLASSSAGIVVSQRTLAGEGAATPPSGWLAKAVQYQLAGLKTRPVAAESEPETGAAGPARDEEASEAAKPTTERVLERRVGFLAFLRRVLTTKTRAFTHAVGQRMNETEGAKAEGGLAEALSGAGAQVDAAALRAALSDARRKSRLQNAVERNPLVVGFSADLLDPSREDIASFGWLLGPQLELSAGDADAKFTQRPVHNPLNAIVSVPSWWRSMRVSLVPFWLTRDGECVTVDGNKLSCELVSSVIQGAEPKGDDKQAKGSDGRVSFEVALPGDERGVQEILLPDAGLEAPMVFRDRMETPTVRAGQPAAIVIPGRHLWKNSTVTLGAQTAERVSVLPDASGIIAKFEVVRWPGAADKNARYRGLPLNVWTSDGQAYAGQVVVYSETTAAKD